jgi:ubiquinol-cytochrome c reductase cytochrome b subunit
VILGVVIPSAFIPGVVIPGALFTLVAVWPFIERRITHDTREHHLLDWPWEAPFRAAVGAAILSFFAILTLAGGNDVLAVFLDLSVESLTWIFRVLVIVGPVVVGLVTWLLCRNRLGRPAPDELGLDPDDIDASPRNPGVALRRTASGGFEEAEE